MLYDRNRIILMKDSMRFFAYSRIYNICVINSKEYLKKRTAFKDGETVSPWFL